MAVYCGNREDFLYFTKELIKEMEGLLKKRK
jgi:hypothetical protein